MTQVDVTGREKHHGPCHRHVPYTKAHKIWPNILGSNEIRWLINRRCIFNNIGGLSLVWRERNKALR